MTPEVAAPPVLCCSGPESGGQLIAGREMLLQVGETVCGGCRGKGGSALRDAGGRCRFECCLGEVFGVDREVARGVVGEFFAAGWRVEEGVAEGVLCGVRLAI